MDINEFKLDLQAVLQKVKSIANIKQDIKIIEAKLPKIKLQGTLNSTATKKELNTKLKAINPKVKVNADTTQAEKKIRKINQQKTSPTITPTVDNSQVVSGLKQAQKETKTLWDRFTNGIMGVNLIRMGVQEVVQAIRQAIAGIKELDAIKTNIQMVSGTTDSGVNAMMSSYNDMAKSLSSTTKEVAEAANEFLRMGESVASTNELIKSSQVLSKVGMIESSEAASYLISSLKGYQVAAQDSMDIVSKLTSVDLEAAVSAGGLAEALSKCSNIANNSGIAMDRLIGYTATIGETTQKSMSEVGNSLQSLLSRMNNIKIGRFIDDETGESLSDTEAVLNKLGIQLRDTEDSYRSFDDVLDDVGKRWDTFNKVEQNAISVAIAGTRQRENFEALMNNYENALKYAETAANSAGSALERYNIYQDSIQAKTNELTAAIESLSTNLISEELYSGIIEATTGLVEFLDKTNLLKASLSGLVAMGVSKAIVSIGTGFITAAKSTAQLTAAMALFDKGKSAENLKAIGRACKGLSDQQLKLVLSTKGLTHGNRLLILAGKGVEESEREQTLTTLGFSAAEDKATISTFSFKGALNSLWTTISMNPIGAIVTAATVATMVFTGFNKAMEEVRQKAKELGDSFKSTKSEIEDYKSQIEELHKTINDSNSSVEDVTNARKTLMSVQDELIDKFGTEKGVINDVTDAINGQTDALDRLTNAKWQEIKNEFNDGGFWNNVANWSQGYEDNIDRMVDEMENTREILSFSYNDYIGKNGDFSEIKRQLEQLGWVYKDTLGGYVKEGNLEGIYSDILKIQDLVENFDAPDMLIKDLTKDANSIKSTLDDYKDMWNTYVLQDRIFADKDLADRFKNINDAYAEYQKIFASGDEDSISKAQDNFANILTQATEGLDDQSVIDYFNNMYPALQSVVSGWKFNVAFDANTDELRGKVQSVLDELKDENGRSLTTEEILGLDAENEQYQALISIAHDYNMTLEEMIELLKERNLVSDMDYQGLVDLFGQEDVDKLSPEDLKIAYTIENIGNMTFEQLQQKIEERKSEIEGLNGIEIKSFEDAWADSFTSESDAVKKLGDTLLELAEKGRLTTETFNEADSTDYFKNLGISADEAVAKINKLVDESKQLSSMSDQISSMSEALATKQKDGFVSADTLSGFDVEVRGLESWDHFQEVLGSTASSYKECEEAANALATEWVNSSDFLAQLSDQNEEYYKTQLKAMGVENYEEVIEHAQALNEAKEVLMQSSLELGEATQDDIEALIEEGKYSELTANMILALYDAKVAEQAANIDTAADCENLIALAGDTDRTSKSVELLIQLMNIYKSLESGVYDNNKFARAGVLAVATGIKAQLEAIANIGNENIEIEPKIKLSPTTKTSAKEAGKDAGKEIKDGLKEELSNLESIISGISKAIDDQKEVITSQKEVALEAIESQIDALEAERDARLEAIEAEKKALEEKIKAIDKQIKAKQDEIDAINDAATARQHEIDLQKAQYELERMQNQRTMLVYSEDRGMHYRADESGVRDAKESVDDAKRQLDIDAIEREIDLLEDSKDLLNEQIELLEEQADNIKSFYDVQIKSLEKQKESTEKYFESLIKSIEGSKDKYQELLDIVDKAELSGKLKKLGIDEEALLNGSEEEFEKLKNAYLNVVFQLNEGNEEFLSSLRDLSGYEGNAPVVLSDTAEKLDEMNTQLDDSTQSMDKLSDSATTASEGTSAVAENMGELNTNTEGLSENLTSINDALNGLPETDKLEHLATSFTELGKAIKDVADKLGIGEDGAVSTLVTALQEISTLSLDGTDGEGVITQFQNLKTAIEDVTSAISGGGSSGGQEGDASGSSSPSMSSGAGGDEGASGLLDAIEEIKTTTDESLGGGEGEDSEGEGSGAIPQFHELQAAVDDVTAAIGSEESEGEEGENTLIGALRAQYETASEVLPETKALFEELLESIMACVGALNSMVGLIGSMSEIGVGGGVGIPTHAKGTVGNAFADGTHYKGLPHDEKNALVSEYGQTEMTVLPNGKTIITDEPTMMDLPKDTVIYNEKQAKKIMDNKVDASGNAHAGGTVGKDSQVSQSNPYGLSEFDLKLTKALREIDGWITLPDGQMARPLREGDQGWDMLQKFNTYMSSIDNNVEKLSYNIMHEQSKHMHDAINQINNGNIVNNNRNVQPIVNQNVTISCPNVTNNSGVENIQKQLGHLSQRAEQVTLRDY